MSEVTSIILTFNTDESFNHDKDEFDNIIAINYWLPYPPFGPNLRYAGEATGGNKYIQADMYMGAFGNFDLDGFLGLIMELHWDYPEHVQLFIKGEHDDVFTVWGNGGKKLWN